MDQDVQSNMHAMQIENGSLIIPVIRNIENGVYYLCPTFVYILILVRPFV